MLGNTRRAEDLAKGDNRPEQFLGVGAAIASTVGTIGWNLVMLVYVRRAMGIDASAMALAPRAA